MTIYIIIKLVIKILEGLDKVEQHFEGKKIYQIDQRRPKSVRREPASDRPKIEDDLYNKVEQKEKPSNALREMAKPKKPKRSVNKPTGSPCDKCYLLHNLDTDTKVTNDTRNA